MEEVKVKRVIKNRITKMKELSFLFTELVKRDFKKKYKSTVLGIGWSLLSPLLTLLVMKIVFTQFFGKDTPNYTTYLFSGTLVMAFFKEATKGGMNSLTENADIITKVNVPKYLFLFSKNVSSLVNFALTLVVYIIFCALDNIKFGVHMLALIYPVVCLTIMNVGIGMILSALYVFFRDTRYLYDIFLTLLNYLSAIFYKVDKYGAKAKLFLLNPVYCVIKYFRVITIDGDIPSLSYHLLLAFYAVFFFSIGCYIYKKKNHTFVYYF